MTIFLHLIAKNLVDFANCAILSQEVQNAQNVPHYVLQESTLVPAFARLVKQDVPMLLSFPVLLLQKPCQFLKRSLLNLPLNLATTFLNLTARKLVDFAGFAMFLVLTKLGLNAQPIVSAVLTHVPKLVMLAKQDVWNSFHQFLIYQLQLMRKYNYNIMGYNSEE